MAIKQNQQYFQTYEYIIFFLKTTVSCYWRRKMDLARGRLGDSCIVGEKVCRRPDIKLGGGGWRKQEETVGSYHKKIS